MKVGSLRCGWQWMEKNDIDLIAHRIVKHFAFWSECMSYPVVQLCKGSCMFPYYTTVGWLRVPEGDLGADSYR
jgi:hypothetical protein